MLRDYVRLLERLPAELYRSRGKRLGQRSGADPSPASIPDA